MAFKILKLRRGVEAALPPLQEGELVYCMDTKRLFIGTLDGNQLAQNVELDKKVDKVSGKGLSTNDYTTTEKNNLASIATDLTEHTGNSGIHVASEEKTNWNNAKTVTDNVVKTWGTYTLSPSSWSTESDTGYMKQTFAVTGMQAAHNPTMIPVFTSLELSADEKKGFGLLIDATTTAGYVTVRCSAVPTVEMKFKLVGV